MSQRLNIAATIKSIEDLPAISAVAQKVLSLLQDPNFVSTELCDAIESDQALAARILKLVNSPAYGIARDVKSVDRAVVLLGSDALKNLVLCAGVSASMEAMGTGVDLSRFWKHAVFVGTATRVLSERTGLAEPGEAFLAGLVHDIGELALGVVQPDRWERVTSLGARERLANEKRYLGLTHQRAGHILLTGWNMPEDLCSVARDHHVARELTAQDRPLMTLVGLADVMSRLAGAGADPPLEERLLSRLLRHVELPLEELVGLIGEVQQRLATKSAFLGLEEELLVPATGSRSTPAPQVVLLGSGKRRLTWLHTLCRHHGFEALSLVDFLHEPHSADLILLDQGSLARDQLVKLAPFLLRSGAAMAICGEAPDDLVFAALQRRLPRLDLTFGPGELAAIMALQPVAG